MIANKKIIICYFIVPFVGLVSYFNAIKAGFAYDDNRAIISNADILQSTPWVNIWKNDFWGTPLSHSGSHKSFRPLTVISFRLNYFAGKLNPMGYHLINVLIHSVNSLLFFVLATSLFKNAGQCLVGSLLFAVHPIHTEAVTGVVGRADVLSCMFFLVSILSYQKGTSNITNKHRNGRPTQWGFVFASVLSSIAAMLCKETGLTALAVCLLYDIIFHAKPQLDRLKGSFIRASSRGCFIRILILLFSAFLALSWRLQIMDLRTPNFYNSDNPTANHEEFKVRVLTFLYLPVLNFYLLLFPWQLSFDWSMDAVPLVISFYDKRNIESILFYSALGALTYRFVGSMSSCSTFRLKSLTYAIDSPSANEIKWAKETNLKQAKPCSITSMINLKFNCMYGNDSDLMSETPGSVFRNNSSKNHTYPIFFDRSHFKKTATAQNNNCSNNELNKGSSTALASNRRLTKTDWKRPREAAEFYSANVNEDASLLNPQPHDIDEQCSYHSFDVAIFSIGITVISFLPASNLFFYVGFVIAERVLYIPSIGFCLLFSVGFGHVLSTCLKFRPFLKGGVLCFLCLLMLRTILRNEDWRDEEALYRSGLHINPAKAWSNLGIILSNKGRFKAAEEAYRNALAARPNMADTHYNLGILLQNMRRYDESIRSYKNAIVFRPSLASAHLNLGLVFDEIGLKQQALEILENAKSLSDHGLKNPKAHQHSLMSIKYNIGKILFDLGKHKKSVRVFHEAIDDMPASFAPHSLYNMLGQSYSFLGNNKRAEEWYLKSLRVNETHVPAHLTYARHLALNGNARAAEQWYSKALQLSPDNSDAHYHFAEFLLKSGRKAEGFAKLERAVELKPDQEDLLSFAATSFREAGMYDKAELFYRKAILVNPKNPVHHMNLGALLHLTGRLDEAEVSYLEADRLNPNDALTLTNLRKLRSMKARSSSRSHV